MGESEAEMVWQPFLDEDVFSDYQGMAGDSHLSFHDELTIEQNTQSSCGDTEAEDFPAPLMEVPAVKRPGVDQVGNGDVRFAGHGSLVDPTSSFWKRVKVTIRETKKAKERDPPAKRKAGSRYRSSIDSIDMDAPAELSQGTTTECALSSDLYARLKVLMQSSAPRNGHRTSGCGGVQLPEIGPVLQGVRAAQPKRHDSSAFSSRPKRQIKVYRSSFKSSSARGTGR